MNLCVFSSLDRAKGHRELVWTFKVFLTAAEEWSWTLFSRCIRSAPIPSAFRRLHQIRQIRWISNSWSSTCFTISGRILLTNIWLARLSFYSRNLILFNCIYQLLKRFFHKLNFVHLGLLIFFYPTFDRKKSRLVELLRFDKHVDPLFLLSLQIFYNWLVVDQVLLIFRKVLCTDILNLFDFTIVLYINVIVALVYLFVFFLHFC